MNPDDVTVADASGTVLHAPGMDHAARQQQSDRADADNYDSALEKKIEDMVELDARARPRRGHRRRRPRHEQQHVSVDRCTQKPVANANTPLVSNNSSEKLGSGSGATVPNGQLGVPAGTGINTGTAGGTTTPTSYEKLTNNDTNAVDSTVTNATLPPGTVKHLSVSVLLDNSVVKPNDIANIWQPSILAAAGIIPTRDGANALKVTTIAFDKTAQKAAQGQLAAASSSSNALFDLIKHFLTLLMIAVVLFFAWKAIKRAENNRVPLRVPLDLLELEAPAALEPAFAGAPRVAAAPVRSSLDPPPNTIEGEITDLIERQPDEVAQTLRSWLADRRT